MKRCVWGVAMACVVVGLLGPGAGCQSYREGSSRTVGEFTDDVGIQSRVKLALLGDPEIKGLNINTEVHKGVVSLFGRVASHEQKQRAIELAAAIKGVKRVEDRLTIVPE